ncbi:PKD domain-containing protein [Paenibacillus sp. P26]|nr:PKD domain-containing protein [Paenibacillus sp. P26]
MKYVTPTGELYKESGYPEDTQPNSRPVAKFAPDKPAYRIGEPVKLVDLSYDPDAEGLPDYEWSGKQEAYFAAGTYEVTLRVRDGKGHLSDPYTHTIVVKPELYLSAAEYPWYYAPVGSVVPDRGGQMAAKWNQAPQLQATIRRPEDRKLVVGTDGKGIGSTGLYYRDRARGKARLYAYPVNAAGVPLQWGITVSNPSADKKVTVKATKEGKLNPTLFSYSAASQAVMDYMSYRGEGRTLEVPAGQTVWLDAVRLEPGQGAVQLADIETDGDAIVSFAAAKPEDSALQAVGYPAAEAADAARGTYRSADHAWEAEAGGEVFRDLRKWTIGEGSLEPPVQGLDALAGTVKSAGAAKGSDYSLRLNHPRAAAVAVRPVNGVLTGTVKVNGQPLVPPAGGIAAQDGAWLIARTTGKEAVLDMEYIPSPGSAETVEWLLFPLEDLK